METNKDNGKDNYFVKDFKSKHSNIETINSDISSNWAKEKLI